MLTILACIFVFGILVTVHELGHFITAKMTGMKVEEFSIGFGPKIYQQQDGETLYSLRMIPLGGYNKIAGMDPEDPEDTERGFNSKPVASRMLVILAGSLMNFVLPVLIFFGIFLAYGMEVPEDKPILGQVVEGYPAAQSGSKEGDRILSIDGKPVNNWLDIRNAIAAAGIREVPFKVQRGSNQLSISLKPDVNPETGKPFIGVVSSLKKVQLSPSQAAVASVTATKNIVKKCQGITKKTRTKLTGNGTLKLKLHIKRSIYIAIYGLNNTGLKTGVYAYGTGNEYPELSLTAQISNEDGAKKYKGYPRLMANGGPKMDIVNGEEEVAEVEIEFNILPDEYGNGVYEALVDDLTDETLISTWLTAFSSDFVRQSTTTTTESSTPTA